MPVLHRLLIVGPVLIFVYGYFCQRKAKTVRKTLLRTYMSPSKHGRRYQNVLYSVHQRFLFLHLRPLHHLLQYEAPSLVGATVPAAESG